MTFHSGDSLDKLLLRERLFARLRLAALALLATAFVFAPRPVGLSLGPAIQLVAVAFILSLGIWALLRNPRAGRWLALLGAVGDAVFLIIAIAFSGGFASPFWPLVLALIAAAVLRYGTWGAFFTALAFGGIHFAYGALDPGGALSLYAAGVRSLSFVAVSLMLGWVIRLERLQTDVESEQSYQALQRSQSEVKSFAALSGVMSGNTNYQATLRQILELSLRSLRVRGQPDDGAAALILLFDGPACDTLLVAAQAHVGPDDAARSLTPIEGSLKTVLQLVDPQTLRDARRDPLLGRFDISAKYPSAVILSLRSGLSMYGAAVFFGLDKLLEMFSERQELIEAYMAQAAVAVQNAKLFDQLDAERNRIMDSEERVRHELARDLHDGPINQVASLAMGLEFARLLLDKEPRSAREELVNLQRLAAKTARDMRTTMYRLRPLALETAGLSVALEQYLARLKADHERPQIHFAALAAPVFEKRLSANSATMVFDIVNEAIGNALKHAEAQNLWVELHSNGTELVASVRDDGRGFDLASVQADYTSRGSLGMINIYERAALAKGEAIIDSEPGRGTLVTVQVPLNP